MAKSKNTAESEAAHSFRFTLKGLALFTLILSGGTALVCSAVLQAKPKPLSFPANGIVSVSDMGNDSRDIQGAWGELVTQNILLERPYECIAAEDINPPIEAWSFNGMDLARVRQALTGAGLTQEQVEAQTAPDHVSLKASNVTITPDESFLLSLKTDARRKLYDSFYGLGLGTVFDNPLVLPASALDGIYTDPRLNSEDRALLKNLVYPAANGARLTDYNLLLRKIPTVERRMNMAKVLTMIPATLPRLCIRPDTDIDKIATYWARIDNVHFNDVRQLMEALKKAPGGGTIALDYLLPPFARSRLYTFPLPKQMGDPTMDCHWSTFNFDKLQPDNGFNNPDYMSEYLIKNFYQIDSPGILGDILLFRDDRNVFEHSAVYIADDLYFNKYGSDAREPWIIAHFADIQAMYSNAKPEFYRGKGD